MPTAGTTSAIIGLFGSSCRCNTRLTRTGRRLTLLLAVLAWPLSASHANLHAQTRAPQPSHITIPSLANATKPLDLEFEAAECDVHRSGTTMQCRFQQVFLTPAAFDAQTCLITTSGYERIFQKQTDGLWLSRSAPEGACGLVENITLQNDGGAMWTMETRKAATKKDAAPSCRTAPDAFEALSWQNVRRPLTCRFIQPGAMLR